MGLPIVVRLLRHRTVRYASAVGAVMLFYGFSAPSGPVANAAPDCSKPLVIGVHGVGEGPDVDGSGNFSVVLTDTVNRLRDLERQHGDPVAEVRFLGYRTIDGRSMTDLDFWRSGNFPAAVKTASRSLSRGVTQARDECPGRRVALVGYSLGAWIVDDYLAGQTTRFRQRAVSAVVLYGDPEWPTPSPGGLAREFTHIRIDPYKPPGLEGRFMSMCLRHDIVCNGSHDSTGTRVQEMATCVIGLPNCAHRRYHLDGATEHGADALYVWTKPAPLRS
jgi:cutinase